MSFVFGPGWVGVLIIGRTDVVEIDEPCAHEIQFGGLCAECGKDMTELVFELAVCVCLSG